MAVLKIERGPGSGSTFFVDQEATIGRDASQVTIHLADSKVSGYHAQVLKEQDTYYIRDNSSRNGTYLNGKPVVQKTALEPGDYISIGGAWLCFGEEQDIEKIAKQLPAYDILQEIESVGNVGHYFKVRQVRLDRIVTLHLLPPNIIKANPQIKKKFRHQARALAKLNHENVSIMLDFEAQESYLYVTSEYVEGEPLSNLLRGKKKISIEEALEISSGIAHGLAHAHSQGVVHQDIRPSNVMLSERRVILGGFGVGAVLSEVKDKFAGLVSKTEYISPEQAQGREVDYRADIYSMGIIMYELLAGRVPFTAEDPNEVIQSHLNDIPPAITNFNSDVPAEIEKLVYQCLEKECESRPQDAEWIANTLDNILLKRKTINAISNNNIQKSAWFHYAIVALDQPIITWSFFPILSVVLLFICKSLLQSA